MGMDVYANGMSIACKAADGKTIAAMPDVCLSPPTPPAGPVPIPYPNTAMASDTDQGTKTVQIGGQEVMMKDSSTFKKSSGDEAATKSLGMGVVTACIQGEVSFVAWSMDVKFEGANVPRNLDLTLHNEQSVPANTPTWPYIDTNAAGAEVAAICNDDIAREQKACKNVPTKAERCSSAGEKCRKAQKCMLRPHSAEECCPGEERHHLVEVHCFTPTGGRDANARLDGMEHYNPSKAPCVCAVGGRSDKEHGALHAVAQTIEALFAHGTKTSREWPDAGELVDRNGTKRHPAESHWNYSEARDAGCAAHKAVYPHCDPDCTKAQVDAYHTQRKPHGPGLKENTAIRTDTKAEDRTRGALTKQQQTSMEASVVEMIGTVPW